MPSGDIFLIFTFRREYGRSVVLLFTDGISNRDGYHTAIHAADLKKSGVEVNTNNVQSLSKLTHTAININMLGN